MSPATFKTGDDESETTLKVGGKTTTRRKRPPFGTYLDADLQKKLKMACVEQEIEIQDAVDQAIRDWIAKNSA